MTMGTINLQVQGQRAIPYHTPLRNSQDLNARNFGKNWKLRANPRARFLQWLSCTDSLHDLSTVTTFQLRMLH